QASVVHERPMRKLSGYGVKAARIPRVAAGDAFQTEACAFERTIFLYCLGGVFRTAREKTAAAPNQWADRVLIDADQCQQQFHRLIVQVRSFFPAGPVFLQPELAGRAV